MAECVKCAGGRRKNLLQQTWNLHSVRILYDYRQITVRDVGTEHSTVTCIRRTDIPPSGGVQTERQASLYSLDMMERWPQTRLSTLGWVVSGLAGIVLPILACASLAAVEGDGKTPKPQAKLFRLAIAPVALYALYDFGYGHCWDCGIYDQLQVT